MSGGHFEYKDRQLQDIIDNINIFLEKQKETRPENLIKLDRNVENYDEYYYYPDSVITSIEFIKELCDVNRILLHEVDWLLSGDSDELGFINNFMLVISKFTHTLQDHIKND